MELHTFLLLLLAGCMAPAVARPVEDLFDDTELYDDDMVAKRILDLLGMEDDRKRLEIRDAAGKLFTRSAPTVDDAGPTSATTSNVVDEISRLVTTSVQLLSSTKSTTVLDALEWPEFEATTPGRDSMSTAVTPLSVTSFESWKDRVAVEWRTRIYPLCLALREHGSVSFRVTDVYAIRTRQDVVEYLIYRLCLPDISIRNLRAIASILEYIASEIGNQTPPTNASATSSVYAETTLNPNPTNAEGTLQPSSTTSNAETVKPHSPENTMATATAGNATTSSNETGESLINGNTETPSGSILTTSAPEGQTSAKEQGSNQTATEENQQSSTAPSYTNSESPGQANTESQQETTASSVSTSSMRPLSASPTSSPAQTSLSEVTSTESSENGDWNERLDKLCQVVRAHYSNHAMEMEAGGVSTFHTMYDVIDYLIYRLCLPDVTPDDVHIIGNIVDKLEAAIGNRSAPLDENSIGLTGNLADPEKISIPDTTTNVEPVIQTDSIRATMTPDRFGRTARVDDVDTTAPMELLHVDTTASREDEEPKVTDAIDDNSEDDEASPNDTELGEESFEKRKDEMRVRDILRKLMA
ncbi:uncharacterized protein [Diadema setosum]|uniref:uncharacterized protein n=1 Tax=Diadema setosum TaxID=31175 RepID=UPI003B3B1486